MKRKISKIVLNVILLLLGVVTVYPFVWMLASSFKKNGEIMALEQHLLHLTADGYGCCVRYRRSTEGRRRNCSW